MRSFVNDAVAQFAGSVANNFKEFLFGPKSTRAGSPRASECSIPSPTRGSSRNSNLGNDREVSPQRIVETLRDKIEKQQHEINYLRDTMLQAMVILEKPSDDDVDRAEFLAELWRALNKRDRVIARAVAVTEMLLKENKSLTERNVELVKEGRISHEKVKLLGLLKGDSGFLTKCAQFLDAPNSKFRELIQEIADVTAQRDSLMRHNRTLMEAASQAKLTTLRLARSASEDSKRFRRKMKLRR